MSSRTVEIPLSNGSVALVDPADAALRDSPTRWFVGWGGYAIRHVPGSGHRGQDEAMHRVIMGPPHGMQVDHINGNRLDNRRGNLRICTAHQNCMNTHACKGAVKYKGVTCVPGRTGVRWNAWIASTKRTGSDFIGSFLSAEDAALAYDAAARERFGEFAWPNFPDMHVSLREVLQRRCDGTEWRPPADELEKERRDRLVQRMRETAFAIGGPVPFSEWRRRRLSPSAGGIVHAFGTWNEGWLEAGYDACFPEHVRVPSSGHPGVHKATRRSGRVVWQVRAGGHYYGAFSSIDEAVAALEALRP